MKKWIFRISLVILFLLMGNRSMNVLADNENSVMTKEELQTIVNEAKTNEIMTINLTNDLYLDSGIKISGNKTIILNGNSHQIIMSASNFASEEVPNQAMFVLTDGAKLTVNGLNLSGEYKSRIFSIDKTSALTLKTGTTIVRALASTTKNKLYAGQAIYNLGTVIVDGLELSISSRGGYYGVIYNAGKFTIDDIFIHSVKSSYGGAIYNENKGEFIMNSGTISQCIGLSDYGAAISNLGTFYLNGASICDNNSSCSAVYNMGDFYFTGGKITKNTNNYMVAEFTSGGTVYNRTGNFYMTGGSITENTSHAGGGVFLYSGKFTIDGEDANIAENTAIYEITSSTNVANYGNGGGVMIRDGEFYLKQGNITKNIAKYTYDLDSDLGTSGRELKVNGNGGGFFVQNGSLYMSGGSVSANETQGINTELGNTQGLGGAICVNGGQNAYVKLSGGSIKDNIAAVETTEGIYLANAVLGGTVQGKNSVCVENSTNISDGIYLTNNQNVMVTGSLADDFSCLLYTQATTPGTNLVEYAQLEDGQKEFYKEEDLDKFIYSTDKKLEFDERRLMIERIDISECTLNLKLSTLTYTGNALKPSVVVSNKEGEIITAFTISYKDNISVGIGHIEVSGDTYVTKGTNNIEFKITPKQITSNDVSISTVKFSYTGKAITPVPVVKSGSKILKEKTDYKVSYDNNIKVGTAAVKVTGIGNFTGVVEKTFTIVLQVNQTFTGKTIYNKTYGDSSFYIDTKRTVGDGKLTCDSSNKSVATISSTGKVKIISAGTTTLTVTAAETVSYKKTVRNITLKVAKATPIISATTVYNKTYGNAAFTLKVKMTKGNAKLTYKSGNISIIKVGEKTGKVTIVGTGRTTIKVNAAATTNYNNESKTITITIKPKKTSISSVKNTASKTMTIKWKKDTKGTGYQIRYSTSKSFKGTVKTSLATKNTITIKSISDLTKNKVYYVQVRTYRLVNGKALFGDWSVIKSVKIKK